MPKNSKRKTDWPCADTRCLTEVSTPHCLPETRDACADETSYGAVPDSEFVSDEGGSMQDVLF